MIQHKIIYKYLLTQRKYILITFQVILFLFVWISGIIYAHRYTREEQKTWHVLYIIWPLVLGMIWSIVELSYIGILSIYKDYTKFAEKEKDLETCAENKRNI